MVVPEPTQCQIDIRQVNSTFLDVWWSFVAVTPTRDVIMESETFKSGRANVDYRKQETLHLGQFISQLESQGWVIARRPEPGLKRGWYQYGFTKNGVAFVVPDPVPYSFHQPTQRDHGLSVQWMWAITVLVILGLFVCCILLVLTSEMRIGST